MLSPVGAGRQKSCQHAGDRTRQHHGPVAMKTISRSWPRSRQWTPAPVPLRHDDGMPRLPQPIIEVAWRHSGEVGKIHYRARRPDGTTRHLLTREGDALCELLDQHLLSIGYTGPRGE